MWIFRINGKVLAWRKPYVGIDFGNVIVGWL